MTIILPTRILRYNYFTYALMLFMATMPSIGYTQGIKTYQLSLKDSNASEIYAGVPNEVRITGLKPQDKVSFNHHNISDKKGSDVFTITGGNEPFDTLVIFRNNKMIFSKAYRVARLPDPILRLGIAKGPTATVNEILVNPRLIVETGNIKNWFFITSFDITVQVKAVIEGPLHESGNCLSPYQIELIKHLHSGDKIFLENIRATCSDCAIRQLNSVFIIIR